MLRDAVRVLTWNLFHGRSRPPAGRPLLNEFAEALDGWAWDVALLQEVPPWWPPMLARACGADARTALTSRNQLLRLRRALSSRRPDILKANGGGANAILVRGQAHEHRSVVLTPRPERRVAHGVRLADGTWVVNLHLTTQPKERTRADLALAAGYARAWAGGAPAVLGGDFNLTRPAVPGFEHVASHHVDHVFVRGLAADGDPEVLDAGTLSDHKPLLATVERVAPA
jgi:endonuclease/exonuclease/phosphatase family metal-dependent hydrolase